MIQPKLSRSSLSLSLSLSLSPYLSIHRGPVKPLPHSSISATSSDDDEEEDSIENLRREARIFRRLGAEMVFNSPLVVSVARLSADLCQYIACNPQRLSTDQVLRLVCCLPLQQLGRLALCLWSFICFPSLETYSSFYYSSSRDSDSDYSDANPPPSSSSSDDDSHSD